MAELARQTIKLILQYLAKGQSWNSHETPLEEADRLVAEMEAIVGPDLAPERVGLNPTQAAKPKFDAYGNKAPHTKDPAILATLRSYNDLTTLERIGALPLSGLTADERDMISQTYNRLYSLTSEADRLRDEANRASTTHAVPTKRKRRLWGR